MTPAGGTRPGSRRRRSVLFSTKIFGELAPGLRVGDHLVLHVRVAVEEEDAQRLTVGPFLQGHDRGIGLVALGVRQAGMDLRQVDCGGLLRSSDIACSFEKFGTDTIIDLPTEKTLTRADAQSPRVISVSPSQSGSRSEARTGNQRMFKRAPRHAILIARLELAPERLRVAPAGERLR